MKKVKETKQSAGVINNEHCIRPGLDFGQHRSMRDIDSCPETLRLLREIHSPGLFKVLDLISRRS